MEVSGDERKARRYYEGCTKFMTSLTKILEALTNRVSFLAVQDLRSANTSQIYAIFLLVFVMMLSPVLIVLAKNGITSIQVRNISCKAFKDLPSIDGLWGSSFCSRKLFFSSIWTV